MSTINYTYNVIVDRFRQFAAGHFQLRRFTHGEISQADLEKEAEWPWMHVKPRAINYSPGTRAFSFEVFISDLPRDKEDKTGYQAESITDCSLIFQDLINEIHLGQMFGDDVVLTRPVNSEPFVEQYTHTLTGVTGTIELNLDYDWSACSIPASWNYNTPTNTPNDGFGALQFIESLDQNGVFVSLDNDVEAPGNSYYYGTNGSGVKGWYAISAGGLTCEDLPACSVIISITDDIIALQTDVALKANTADLGATAFSNDYNDLDNLPTIPAAQVNSDWNSVSGVSEILNKPTIPSIAGLVPETRTISTTSPLSGGGDLSANRTLSIAQANTSTNGYLSSTDWNTFNGKQAALGFTPENTANKQNSLAVDGTGVKFPTVDAVNALSFIDKGKRMVSFFTDFLTNATLDGAQSFASGGSLGLIVGAQIPNRTNQQGVAFFQTNTVATNYINYCSSSGAAQFWFGGGAWNYEALININTLSTALERYRMIFGFGSVISNSSEADGVFITYDEGGTANGTIASANWQCVTVANSVRTLTTSTTAVTASAWNKLRIEINAAGTSVTFYVNGTAIATHTTNIPLASNSRYVLMKTGVAKTIGTTTRGFYCDYIGYENILTTAR
jgi:hypothetical protein